MLIWAKPDCPQMDLPMGLYWCASKSDRRVRHKYTPGWLDFKPGKYLGTYIYHTPNALVLA